MGDKSAVSRGARGEGPPEPVAEVPRRLVVELNSRSSRDLGELVAIEELNKTTIVNRAIQVYAMIRRTELGGGRVYLQDPGASELQRLRII
jgi:hypothetical protein